MFDLLGIISLVNTCITGIKEATTPTIPAENWGNKDLIHQDRMNGMSEKQILKNVANGRYIMRETYPEPHRDPVTGKIIIENCLLYNQDLRDHGAVQTMKWVKQGKYNLTPEELEKEHKRIEEKYQRLYELAGCSPKKIK